MATKQCIIGSHFQDLVDNVDIELIAPLMKNAGILSTESEVELENKITRNQKVRFIISKVKLHPSGDQLFKECLEKSKHSQGHQRLLSVVYSKAGMECVVYILCINSYSTCFCFNYA